VCLLDQDPRFRRPGSVITRVVESDERWVRRDRAVVEGMELCNIGIQVSRRRREICMP